jgi:tousled-like kinase
MISSKVDVWSVGVIFYELLYGFRPFGDKQSQKKILREKTIINDAKQVHFPSKPAVSTETKEFIKALLSYNIEDRLSVEQAYFQIISK